MTVRVCDICNRAMASDVSSRVYYRFVAPKLYLFTHEYDGMNLSVSRRKLDICSRCYKDMADYVLKAKEGEE